MKHNVDVLMVMNLDKPNLPFMSVSWNIFCWISSFSKIKYRIDVNGAFVLV